MDDHSAKAGNRGDVLKHAVLARVAEARAQDGFIYVETHAGRTEYVLPDSGKWQGGIGQLATRAPLENARERWRRGEPAPGLDDLRPYDELCLRGPIKSGHRYPGSTVLVERVLTRCGLKAGRFFLFDNNPDVVEDLRRYFGDSPQIGDGYDGLRRLLATQQPMSLVLIDPVNVSADKKDIIDCQRLLLEHKVDFLCWTPLHKTGRPVDEASRACLAVRVEGCAYVAVRWQAWSGQMCGAQLVASPSLAGLAIRTAEQVRALMAWERA